LYNSDQEEVEEVEEVEELDELDAEDTGSPPPPHTPLLQTPSPQFSTHNSVASVFGAAVADFMAPVFEPPAAPVFEEEEEDEEDLFLQQALALSMLPQQTASKEEKEEVVAPDVAPEAAVTEVPETPPPNSPPHSPPLSTLSVDAVAFAPMAAAATKDDKEEAKNEDTEIKQGDEAEETKVETKSIETKEEEAFSVVAPFASFQEELLSKGITLERMMLWNRKDDEILMEWCR